MHAHNRRLAWILGSMVLMGTGAAGAVACGTDNGTTPLPGETDAGGNNKADGTAGGDSGNGGNPDGSSTEDGSSGQTDGGAGGMDCGKIPTLHEAGPGPFCPFQDGGPDGALAFGDCANGEQCCDYQGASGGPPAQCLATGSACPAPTTGYVLIDWTCDTSAHCTGGMSCCMYGKDGGTTSVVNDNTCMLTPDPLLRALNVGGTKCEATCAAGEVKLCANDGDCTSPQKCTAFPSNAKQLGVCK
jgi:hypothetical protein